jgi:hypothetical protein
MAVVKLNIITIFMYSTLMQIRDLEIGHGYCNLRIFCMQMGVSSQLISVTKLCQ